MEEKRVLRPEEISIHQLPKSAIGGYDVKKTDAFLTEIANCYSALWQSNLKLQDLINRLSAQLEQFATEQDTAANVSLINVVGDAQTEANRIIEEAKRERDALIAEGERQKADRLDQISQEIERAKANLVAQRDRYMSEIKQEREALESAKSESLLSQEEQLYRIQQKIMDAEIRLQELQAKKEALEVQGEQQVPSLTLADDTRKELVSSLAEEQARIEQATAELVETLTAKREELSELQATLTAKQGELDAAEERADQLSTACQRSEEQLRDYSELAREAASKIKILLDKIDGLGEIEADIRALFED